ncbi:hypothetical protein AAC387_Pa03g2255 [Persea americana]
MGHSVIKAVQHFFQSKKILRASNAFFLSLIPKSKSPNTFADFRPISLLNFSYKIISKILATRLTTILPKLISPHQAAFIKGCSIQHHSALAFELFQKLKSKLSKGSFLLKLDISKAFDKLNWSFLFSTLRFFRFSEAWISLITECICTTRCSVLINRSPQGFFSSSCGLRQGDPLSPYLFIIAEEILSLHIQNLQSQGIISPLSTVPSTPCQLLYADDIIIFMKGARSGVLALQALLDLYQSSSCQHFNPQKSQLIFGKCGHRRKSRICSFLGLQAIERLLRHFLWSGSASTSKFNYVNWVQVSLPKEEGGLGIRKIKKVNEASLIKLGWQASTSISLWSTWFTNNYFKFSSIWNPANSIYGSCIWKKILRLVPHLHQGSIWTSGNGKDINVWHDTWCGDRAISAEFHHPQFPPNQCLSSLFHSGSWHIPHHLPSEVQHHLASATSNLLPCLASKDSLSWKGAPAGQLSLKLAWNSIRSRGDNL